MWGALSLLVLAAECGGGKGQFSYPRHGLTLLLTVRSAPYCTESPAQPTRVLHSVASLALRGKALSETEKRFNESTQQTVFSIPSSSGEHSSQERKLTARVVQCTPQSYSLPPHWPGSCSSYWIRSLSSPNSSFWVATYLGKLFLFLMLLTSS